MSAICQGDQDVHFHPFTGKQTSFSRISDKCIERKNKQVTTSNLCRERATLHRYQKHYDFLLMSRCTCGRRPSMWIKVRNIRWIVCGNTNQNQACTEFSLQYGKYDTKKALSILKNNLLFLVHDVNAFTICHKGPSKTRENPFLNLFWLSLQLTGNTEHTPDLVHDKSETRKVLIPWDIKWYHRKQDEVKMAHLFCHPILLMYHSCPTWKGKVIALTPKKQRNKRNLWIKVLRSTGTHSHISDFFPPLGAEQHKLLWWL